MTLRSREALQAKAFMGEAGILNPGALEAICLCLSWTLGGLGLGVLPPSLTEVRPTHSICIYLRCAVCCLDIRVPCEMPTVIKLLSIFITSHGRFWG